MKIFLDANILVSVLNKEYPLYPYTSRILSLSQRSRFRIYTSPICLAIAFYFAEKKHGRVSAKKKINLLAEHILISSVDEKTVSLALKNKQINDFEDGLEYYSAIQAGCQCIITEDSKDFLFATKEVMRSEEFVEKYMH